MKFFFPDSQDLVDPSFDFEKESRSDVRIRHQDDQYAHEVFSSRPMTASSSPRRSWMERRRAPDGTRWPSDIASTGLACGSSFG